MIKHGQTPFLECSSHGDKRLSAFYARPSSLKGRSIEQAYQAMKIIQQPCCDDPSCQHCEGSGIVEVTGLTWREAKGKRALNADECAAAYTQWWKEYIDEHPELLKTIKRASGLSDKFGQPNHCCQATELWNIRNTQGDSHS